MLEVERFQVVPEAPYRIVPKTLPIVHLIDFVTHRDKDMANHLIEQATREYSDPYERWEAVRRSRADIVTGSSIVEKNSGLTLRHTGWEGFYVGRGMSSEEIVMDQAQIGARVVKTMETMYPDSYQRIKRIFETKRGYSLEDLKEIEIWFKVIKSRFDARELPSEGEIFRRQTTELVQKMPPIVLERDVNGITQFIPVPARGELFGGQTIVNMSPKELAGYRFMENVGIVGQPPIRAMLKAA